MNPVTEIRNDIIRRVIGIEGGYINDKRDSGGATKYGITAAVARKHGLDVQALTVDQATDIYANEYWKPLQLDGIASLSPAIAEELFDSGVNTGISRAGEWLQRSLNVLNNGGKQWADVRVDGDVGAKTLDAVDTFFRVRGQRAETVLLRALNSLQGAFYMELAERRPKDEAFTYGWLSNRVDDVAVGSPEQFLGVDTIPTAAMVSQPPERVQMAEPSFADHPKNVATNPRRIPVLDWLPGIKTHIVAFAGVALSVAELMGYGIPEPVYGILASLGVSTAYRGLTRQI
jgi:lysozyme family protein